MGKTPLHKMDIPTGEVSQSKPKTIYFSSETCTVGMRGDRDAGESRGNCMECITLGEPHSDSAPENCPRQTTQVLHVCGLSDKSHSKAKEILTLVPIPKIDKIYAKLEGSTIYSTFDMCSGYYYLELTPESQSKSAFVVGGPRGSKWEFKKCPFGLTQAPAYF